MSWFCFSDLATPSVDTVFGSPTAPGVLPAIEGVLCAEVTGGRVHGLGGQLVGSESIGCVLARSQRVCAVQCAGGSIVLWWARVYNTMKIWGGG